MSVPTTNQLKFALAHPNEPNVVELGFFVHRRELAVLEAAAGRAGLSVGELIRQLICDYLRASPTTIYLYPEEEANGASFP